MPSVVDPGFKSLFLDPSDLPAGMTLYGDRRDGVSDPDDPAFALHGGRNIGMTKWDGANDCLLRLFVDIRWLFPSPQSAKDYHLATLRAKSEGKPEASSPEKVGDDCHVHSFPSGQELGAAQGLVSRALGSQSQLARGIERAVAAMPDDAFIYLFTCGPVAVKFLAVLALSPTASGGPAVVHQLAERIVRRIEGALPARTKKTAPWWRRILHG